nr:alpha-tectorin-like [Ciona intestinalis]|eukprot:XP_002120074.2 alpha-tectorin-like [Ciona intestinalis]
MKGAGFVQLLGVVATGILVFYCKTASAQAQNCSTFPAAPKANDSVANAAYLDLNVTCGENNIFVRLSRCAILGLGYSGNVSLFNSTNQKINHTECIPIVSADKRFISFNFSSSFGTCASNITVTPNNIIYVYKLRNAEFSIGASAVIIRQIEFLSQFSCSYQSRYDISLESGLATSRKAINITAGKVSGTFSQILVMYNDSTFLHALTDNQTKSLTFVVPQYIYFAVVSNADPSQYVMQASDCWVTETNDAASATKYTLISGGCPVKDSIYKDANVVFMNYKSVKIQAGFRSFVWSSGGTSLFLHCTINMCDLRLSNNCTSAPTCPAARRRRSSLMEKPDALLTYGPIHVQRQPTACDHSNGGCSHHCTALRNGRVECSCPLNYVINADGLTCRGKNLTFF